MRVRVLAAEDNVRDNEILLLVEHLEVMRDRHEMHLGRQHLKVRMIPPLCGEDAELSALDDLLNLCLERGVVGGRRDRHIVRVRLGVESRGAAEGQAVGIEHRILERRRRRGIGFERFDGADPVERVQMIEVDNMIVFSE